MGEDGGGEVGGLFALAGGEVDGDDYAGGLGGGEAEEPAVRLAESWAAGSAMFRTAGRASSLLRSGAGFAGYGDAAEGGWAGDAEAGGIGEAGFDSTGGGGSGVGGEFEGEGAVGLGEFRECDLDALDAEGRELGLFAILGFAELGDAFDGGEAGGGEEAARFEGLPEILGLEGAGERGEVGVAGPGEGLLGVHGRGEGVEAIERVAGDVEFAGAGDSALGVPVVGGERVVEEERFQGAARGGEG